MAWKLLNVHSNKGETSEITANVTESSIQKHGTAHKVIGFCGDNTNWTLQENQHCYKIKRKVEQISLELVAGPT